MPETGLCWQKPNPGNSSVYYCSTVQMEFLEFFFGLCCAQSVIVVKCLIIIVKPLGKLRDSETSVCLINEFHIDRKLMGFIDGDICYWI